MTYCDISSQIHIYMINRIMLLDDLFAKLFLKAKIRASITDFVIVRLYIGIKSGL